MQYARRILAVLLLLALGLGTPVLSAHAGDMTPLTVETAIKQPVPIDCTTCGGDDMAMPTSACFAACTGVQATTPPSGAIFELAVVDFDRGPEQQFRGLISPPDPFPPKLNILA